MATNILLALPAYGNMVSVTTLNTTHALMQAFMTKGIRGGLAAFSYPEVSEARNILLTGWYDTVPDATHLLFIDSDMGFDPQVIFDLLTFNEPMVGAIYSKKCLPVQWAASGLGEKFAAARGDFMKVAGLGMGCFLIRRDAIDLMLQKMPELSDERMEYHAAKHMLGKRIIRAFDPFDNPDDRTHGRMSEDLSFCCRWRQCGGEIWASVGHDIDHVGMHSFKANYARHIAEKTAAGEVPAPPDSPMETKVCKHGTFTYNRNDTFIGRSLQQYGEWCEFELDLLAPLIKPGDTVIDVGAYIGTHTVAFSRMVGDSGQVFAFEAQPRTGAMLETNIRLNELGNVFWASKVVSDSVTRYRIIDLPPDDVQYNFGAMNIFRGPKPSYPNAGLDIDGVTIDSLGLTPDLIKIDVEGMEPDVIRGAKETIARCKPIIYVENNGDDSSAIAAALDEIGYRAYWSIGPYFNPDNFFRNKFDIWPNVMPSVNMIAVPNSDIERWMPFVKANMPLFTGADDNWRKALAAAQAQAAE